jgi:hypothetical protein
MGFVVGDTDAPSITKGQRIHSLGRCSDLIVLSLFVHLATPCAPRADAPTTKDTE